MAELQASIDARGAVSGGAKFEGVLGRMRLASQRGISSIKGLNVGLGRTGKSAGGASSALRRLVGVFALLALAKKTVGIMASFEDTMTQVKGVSRATGVEFESLTTKARELGATTRFTATQAGEGFLALSRGGLSASQQVSAIEPILNLAASSMTDLGTAADLTAGILGQFGLAADETERVVDSLTVTANNSLTNITELGEALKFVGPVANAVGKEVEETAAALGVLADNNIRASQAGTNLRGIFAALLSPTSKAQKAMKELGITAEDLDPKTNTLAQIFGKLRDSGLGASESLEIFGRRNFTAALALTKNADGITELIDKQKELKGETERLAKAQEDTLGGSLRSLKSAFEEVLLSAGDSGLGGGFRAIVDGITDVLRVLTGFDDSIKTSFGRKFKAALDFIRPTLDAIVGIFKGAWQLIQDTAALLWQNLKEIFAAIFGEMTTFGDVATEVQNFVTDAFIGIEFVLRNFGRIVEFVFVSALASILEFKDKVIFFFTEVIPESVKFVATVMRDVFLSVGGFLVNFFTETFNTIGLIFASIPDLITGNIDLSTLTQALGNEIIKLKDQLVKDIAGIKDVDIAEFQVSQGTAEIQQLAGTLGTKLGEDFAEFLVKRRKEIFFKPIEDDVEFEKVGETVKPLVTALENIQEDQQEIEQPDFGGPAAEALSASFTGAAELFRAGLRGEGKKPEAQIVDNTKRGAVAGERTADAMEMMVRLIRKDAAKAKANLSIR